MRSTRLWPVAFALLCCAPALAEDALKLVVDAAKKSTLDQPGTHPFHLRAVLTPTRPADESRNRSGSIEIWWQSPDTYRRELRSPGFHQVEIVNGSLLWQTNEGQYMPAWLDQTADAFLHPLPSQSAAARGFAPDKGRRLMGSTYLNWEKPVPMDMQPPKEFAAITDATGLLFYDGGLGWGALFADYSGFHGRQVPHTVSVGTPEVTAKVTLLEDLPSLPAAWFDAAAPGADPAPIRFVAVDKTNLAQDLASPPPPLQWPDIPNTRASGVIWTDLVIDRSGHIAEPFTTISDNPALNGFLHAYLAGLEFKPATFHGIPVQVVRHVVLHFELGQPATF